jgi:hypothetical protein
MSPLMKRDLDSELWGEVQSILEIEDAVLDDPAERTLKKEIKKGVQRMERSQRTDDSDMSTAKANLGKLLKRAVASGSGQIRSGDIQQAIAGLCPGLWPFC